MKRLYVLGVSCREHYCGHSAGIRIGTSNLKRPTEPNGLSEFNTFVTAVNPAFGRDQSFVCTPECKGRADNFTIVGPEYALADYGIWVAWMLCAKGKESQLCQ